MKCVLLFLTVLCIVQCKILDLTCDQIKAFVNGHNWYRMSLAQGRVAGQPSASYMQYVVWDDELADKAAEWAGHNVHYHNPDRTLHSGRFDTGENIYWFGTTGKDYKFDVESSMKMWFDENHGFKYGPLTPGEFEDEDLDIGHYTQMVWANTSYIGCGVSKILDGDWTRYTVVCNYGPTGNYIGQVPYPEDDEPSNKVICAIGDCSHPYGMHCS